MYEYKASTEISVLALPHSFNLVIELRRLT